MAPKSEREEAISSLASKILSSMIDDLVLDAALQAHHEVSKSRAICSVCNTRCNAVHVPKSSATASQSSIPSRATSPTASTDAAKAANGSTPGTSTPTSVKAEGVLYLECVNCSRQIASTRYAPHLSSCMGLATARRGGVRANAKPKQPSEVDRSASPISDVGNISDDKLPAKKLISKSKRADEAEFSFKRKRPVSPQVSPTKASPNKKQKSQKPSASPVSRVKATSDTAPARSSVPPIPTNSQSKVPSKLRASASLLDRSSATSSRSSSPAVTPLSGSFPAAKPNGKPKGTGPHIPRAPSPPRPAPISHYMMDDDAGNETGSSTDTDSS